MHIYIYVYIYICIYVYIMHIYIMFICIYTHISDNNDSIHSSNSNKALQREEELRREEANFKFHYPNIA